MDKQYLINFVVFFAVIAIVVLVYRQWFVKEDTKVNEDQQFTIEAVTDTGETIELEVEPISLDELEQEGDSGAVESIDGLKIEVLEQGSGQEAKNGDRVSAHYTGVLENGTKFDSSLDRGQPFSFTLGAGDVIKGWDLGILGMKVGEKRKLTIAPELGYGAIVAGGGKIPANSVLIFDVELMAIQ